MKFHASRHPKEHGDGTATSDSDSDSDSSVAVADTLTRYTSASSFLTTSVSSLWGGLVRRFTSDVTGSSGLHAPSARGPHHWFGFDGGLSNHGIDGAYLAQNTHRAFSPLQLPPLEPLTLEGFHEDTTADARLLGRTIAEEIRIMVPARLSIVDQWNLVYSLHQDGASLSTLYEKCRRYEGKRVGFVLVVKDCEGGTFGAYLSDFPRPTPKYFGTGECFLWRASVMASLPPPPSDDTTHLSGRTTSIMQPHSAPDSHGMHATGVGSADDQTPPSPAIRFKAFPYSGENEYFMLCEAHFLSVGAGDGKCGLWLDDGLVRGVSSPCLTFGNERLSDEGEKFRILGVEVWVIGAPGR